MYEITKSIILQQLQDKFALREWIPERFSFLETVIPVYQIEQHLREWITADSGAISISSTTDFMTFTVPANERWYIRTYTGIFATGNYNIGAVKLNRANSDTTMYLEIEEHLNGLSWVHEFPVPLVVVAGDKLVVTCSGHTTTGNFKLYIDYDKEMVR